MCPDPTAPEPGEATESDFQRGCRAGTGYAAARLEKMAHESGAAPAVTGILLKLAGEVRDAGELVALLAWKKPRGQEPTPRV